MNIKTIKNLAFICAAVILVSCTISKPSEIPWTDLFDKTSMDGWMSTNGQNTFSVVDEKLVSEGNHSVLYYTGAVNGAIFRNFEFSADVFTTPGSQAAIYFHWSNPESGQPTSGYAVQIDNGDGTTSGLCKTGSLTAIRDVYKTHARDNEWTNLRIVVKGKNIEVFVNNVQTVDYTEPEMIIREENLEGRYLSMGTFALEAGPGKISFRNIKIRILANDVEWEPGPEYFTPEKQHAVNTLISRGYPLIDYHVHMKGEVTLDDILDKSRRTGIFCSLAPNCGIGFPIDTNEKLEEFYSQFNDVPIFLAMQAEGREWVTTFGKASIAKYDYVFTDAMTFSDRQGNRMQIWKDEQVKIDDPQDFMELLVETIEDVLDHEKIDIYVNATFLPTVIAGDYDALWTEQRMNRVVNALARNGIALEISARYQIPSAAFIRKAKKAGVKFAFGTNNSDHDFANLDYCLAMINECNLQPDDFFFPKPHGFKPVQVK